MNKLKFTVIGGDLRSAFACRYLKEKGFEADTFLLDDAPVLSDDEKRDAFPYSDCYILGLPAADEHALISAPLSRRSLSVKDFFSLVPKNSHVSGGLLSGEFYELAKEKNIRLSDYYRSEELQIKNSVPTAEGAIEIAMREMPMTLAGSNVLIIGYGRIARALIPMMTSLGAFVSVSTRNPDSLAWCSVSGCEPIAPSELDKKIGSFDLIINTAPARVLEGDILDCISSDALIIDLASRPGGVDIKAASLKGLHVIWALGLPGKCAPVTAGRIIAGTVLNIINGR